MVTNELDLLHHGGNALAAYCTVCIWLAYGGWLLAFVGSGRRA